MSFDLKQGSAPLLVSIPHMGTEIPSELHASYQPRALQVEDTDWHLARLYDFTAELGASILRPHWSRYVIDLNRPPDDAPMYPGAANTELCPTRFFTGDVLHAEGGEPDAAERLRRREAYWQPYHAALAGELARIRKQHGFVLLWDAHSIRSEIPWLFEGTLPDLNIGTAGGASADGSITTAVEQAAARFPQYTRAVNRRFKGGYITRHYGRPGDHVHAVQLEMTQKSYMREEEPWDWVESQARAVQPVVRAMVEAALHAARALYGR